MTTTALDYQQKLPRRSEQPRVWTAIVIIILMWALMKVPAMLMPNTMAGFMAMMWAPIIGAAAIVIWLLFFSRLPWPARITGLLALLIGAGIGFALAHPSLKPMGLLMFALPISLTVLAVWTLIAHRSKSWLIPGIAVLVLGFWSLFAMLRMDGLKGDISADISWRWRQTTEDKYLATLQNSKASALTTAPATRPLVVSTGDWPAFRGPDRNGIYTGPAIRTDWNSNPPKMVWKHLIGPGWSSVCVIGDRLYTQEQRGSKELVVCYAVADGKEIWTHEDASRFDEAIAGPGPRATPTFADGKLYAFGARGILNCLDPTTGSLIWSRDVARETNAPLPMWGFSASPLVHEGLVSVITGAPGKALAAYDALSGAPAWAISDGFSYASPQLASLGGAQQIVFISNKGVNGLEPKSGRVLWQHAYNLGQNGNRVVQPAILDGHDFLFGASFGTGTRRVHIEKTGDTWKESTVWSSRKFNPYYNDLVIHKGFAYGFDNSALACMDLANGQVKWRSKDYGNGQVLLLADQNLLLVQAEPGHVALVDAKPDGINEVASFPALDDKTWNHPVIAHGKLFVRNGKEIACFDVAK